MFKKLGKFCKQVYDFFWTMADDRVGVYAAQASFFIILSLFPFALLLLNIITITPFDQTYVINGIESYAPEYIQPLLKQIIYELYYHSSGTIISITAIGAIWSSSKGFLSIMFGIYNINKVFHDLTLTCFLKLS